MSGTHPTVRVFISYSQETAAHQDRCRELADRLRNDGIDAWIDLYVPAPPAGWPQWIRQQIVAANFVVLVCTPTFRRRFEGAEPSGVGNGTNWEGLITSQLLHDNGARNETLVPVLFDDAALEAVPTVLRPFSRHSLWRGYHALYRHLSAQPEITPPPLGARKVMPAEGLKVFPASSPTVLSTGLGSVRSASPMPPGAEAVLRARNQAQALHELLFLLFDACELRMWLRNSDEGEAVLRALPGESVSKAELVFKASDLLSRRGLVDAGFFERLREHLPRQSAVIDCVRARWLGP